MRLVFGEGLGGVGIEDGETLTGGERERALELDVGTLGVEDGLGDVGEDPGLAFGDVTVGAPEEDGVENVGDAFGSVEVLGHFFKQLAELLGAAFGEMVLAERLFGGDGTVAAGASIARDVLAAGPPRDEFRGSR
ncbi:MAG TPA: hypothetical protein VMJ35_13400 [Dongiaceae bacterium]|nr:hypothetical protein [Dongiaceae bacterium]